MTAYVRYCLPFHVIIFSNIRFVLVAVVVVVVVLVSILYHLYILSSINSSRAIFIT